MTFSAAQFQATIDKLNGGMDELSHKIEQVPPAANAAMDNWYVPGYLKDTIKWLAEKITELATWIWNKIKEVMTGIATPAYFFEYAFDWQDIRGIANGVTGQLKPEAMIATRSWTSPAGMTYSKIILPQGNAANKIAIISTVTAGALQLCAAAGLAFYVTIAIILVKFITAMATAIAAFGSGVFSPAGAALVIEEASVNSTLIWSAIASLTALLGSQAEKMIDLHGEAIDNSTFPGGHWPDPTTGAYNHP